ncbi:tRNA-binding protein [Ralstonia flaminis]|jgi:tRNA-binding protein|uniref:Chaperone CsaA n=1 Tax=Ralstonia flaminis TaxID=3058597 RepID=A0ABM9JZ40_9RALS|nr:tRNA-binding protein [Ralstonia sp. LMG 18101]CAJ0809073.1 putative chaperone CsaA [Ralstonia sp. LMG 18101]
MDIYECFSAVDMRVGTVQKVELNERARVPAYKMWIDFGFLGVKTSSGQYVNRYTPEELVGKVVVCAVNLGTRKIAGFTSEVLVMGVESSLGVVNALTVDGDVPNGAKVF